MSMVPAACASMTARVTIAIGSPQSPTWFCRMTLFPSRSSVLAMASPMMIERRCPTCVCFARFTPQRSTTTVCLFLGSGCGRPRSLVSSFWRRFASVSFRRVMLMKPGPAIDFSVSGSARSSSLRFWRIAAATSRGFWLSRLASGIAALIWKSPKVGFLDGATCGS